MRIEAGGSKDEIKTGDIGSGDGHGAGNSGGGETTVEDG